MNSDGEDEKEKTECRIDQTWRHQIEESVALVAVANVLEGKVLR